MQTSAQLTDPELAALQLLVPGYVSLQRDGDAVAFTLRSPRGHRPLVTYLIRPGTSAGFAGDRLAQLVEDLHGTLVTGIRALPEVPDMGDIVRLVGSVSVSTNGRLLADGVLRLETGDIHTVEAEDWAAASSG